MSYDKNGDSLDWLSLFSISEREKQKTIDYIKGLNLDYKPETLTVCMTRGSNPQYRLNCMDTAVQRSCEYVALKFMLEDTAMACDILGEEESEKAHAVFLRKQYNSKLLRYLLAFFKEFLQQTHTIDSIVDKLFALPIITQLRIERDVEAERCFSSLKKVIDRVASGVKSECYFSVRAGADIYADLDDELNSLVIEKYSYNFNAARGRNNYKKVSTLIPYGDRYYMDNKVLQTALLDDASFWDAHGSFYIVNFLNKVKKENSIRHAEKILTHIFDNVKKMSHADAILSADLPLYTLNYDMLVEGLEDQCRRFTFKRLMEYCDVSVLNDVRVCHPMNRADDTHLAVGKALFDKFITEYNYPADKEDVTELLKTEVDRFASGEEERNIALLLDCGPFRSADDEMDRDIFAAYHPDCSSAENLWKRVYMKSYAITLLADDEATQLSYMQRVFIDVIREIERSIGVKTKHQLDMASRLRHYAALKARLAEYGISVSDIPDGDYVVALLDSDVALAEEKETFPALEQLGDAIYDLAVTELLFYNPKTSLSWNAKKKFGEYHELFTRAEAQVVISKKNGFDKLFLHMGLPTKELELDFDTFDYESASDACMEALAERKYLADSLEMLIGAICNDKGADVAKNFAKALLRNTFSDTLLPEVYPTEENKDDPDIDYDYWGRLFAAPFTYLDNELSVLWESLYKALITVSIGTDDKKKRMFITANSHSISYNWKHGCYTSHGSVNWAFHDYLINFEKGFSFTLEKYGDELREFYADKSKQ